MQGLLLPFYSIENPTDIYFRILSLLAVILSQ